MSSALDELNQMQVLAAESQLRANQVETELTEVTPTPAERMMAFQIADSLSRAAATLRLSVDTPESQWNKYGYPV